MLRRGLSVTLGFGTPSGHTEYGSAFFGGVLMPLSLGLGMFFGRFLGVAWVGFTFMGVAFVLGLFVMGIAASSLSPRTLQFSLNA